MLRQCVKYSHSDDSNRLFNTSEVDAALKKLTYPQYRTEYTYLLVQAIIRQTQIEQVYSTQTTTRLLAQVAKSSWLPKKLQKKPQTQLSMAFYSNAPTILKTIHLKDKKRRKLIYEAICKAKHYSL